MHRMFVVLDVWTPGIVSLAEAWITLIGFGVFVLHAYLQDRKWFMGGKAEDTTESEPDSSLVASDHIVSHPLMTSC